MQKQNWDIIALGGSIIVANKLQINYLKRLRLFLEGQMNAGRKFVIVAGGGEIARTYQNAASKIRKLSDEDKDWLGIYSTRLNAHLLRIIFSDHAYPIILDNPQKLIKKRDIQKYPLFIAGGWRPGHSTDHVAFLLAKRFGANSVLVATKIPFVYDKDVGLHKDAKPLREITWPKYIKMIGTKWTPGMKAPVDPIAAQFALKNNISSVVLRGTNLKNLENYLDGKKFNGTKIS